MLEYSFSMTKASITCKTQKCLSCNIIVQNALTMVYDPDRLAIFFGNQDFGKGLGSGALIFFFKPLCMENHGSAPLSNSVA